MRRVTLTNEQFQYFVYPMVSQETAKNDDEFEVALRLLRKFKDPTLTRELPLTTQEEQAVAESDGRVRAYHFRCLREDQTTFVLEEDEYSLLLRRLSGNKTKVQAIAAEDFYDLLEAVKHAAAHKPDVGVST